MAQQGMDPQAMRTLADRLAHSAHGVQESLHRVDGDVRHGMTEWFGPHAVQFKETWWQVYRPQLAVIGGELLGLVDLLRREIAAQEAASSAGASGSSAQGPHPRLRSGESVLYDHGRLRITRSGTRVEDGPRDVRGLLDWLNRSKNGTRAYDHPGGITVTFTGDPPHRRAIVAVSGTENWLVGTKNVDDLETNVQNVAGLHTPKEDAIRQAMIEAGVGPQDRVMLVGHSQGGADVLYFAHDLAGDRRFDIRSVVTVGAPEVVRYPPANVEVLELRGTNDVVPRLGADGLLPELTPMPRNVHVAYVRDATFDNPLLAHEPSHYQAKWPTGNGSIAGFEDRQSEFFDGGPATTYAFSNERTTSAADVFRHPETLLPPLTPVLPPLGSLTHRLTEEL